ncbi:hypothetical protein FFF34_003530 [Inquilinus sp. KBS0705]|nr:hypothetical protein FFF34_003530 [Inquilinus sp. KBS0705]
MEKRAQYVFLALVVLMFACKSKTSDKTADSLATDTTNQTEQNLPPADGQDTASAAATDSSTAPASDKKIANKKAAKKTDEVKRPVEEKKPAAKKLAGVGTSIDRNGFTLVNGNRFFPIGIYTGKGPKPGDWGTSDESLQKMSSAGFNTVLAYTYGDRPNAADFMNRAKAHGLKVIYSVKDMYSGSAPTAKVKLSSDQLVSNYVDIVKNSPNLLAWYTNDELGMDKMALVSSAFQNIRSRDSQHIIFQVNNQINTLSSFARTADVIGTDPYVITGNNFGSLKRVTDWTHSAKAAAGSKKGVWQVVQMFDKKFQKSNLASHPPTADEMRNIAFQSLIAGSKGLMFYAYHWLFYGPDKKYSEAAFNKRWPDVVQVVREVKNISPIILQNQIVDIKRTGFAYTQYRAWKSGDNLYLMLANTEQKTAANIFTVPAGNWKLKSSVGIPGKLMVAGNNVRVNLAPLGSGVIILEK